MRLRRDVQSKYTHEWRQSITVSELNDADEYGRNVLMSMAARPEGRHAIDVDEEFRKKITAEGFCLLIEKNNISAAGYFLTSEDGLLILSKRSDLLAKLNADCMNKRSETGGMPNLFPMMMCEGGVELLANPDVRNLISEKSLNVRTMHRSPLFVITKTDKGIALLVDENFRKKIRAKTLNAFDEHEGHSVVANLCQSESGREALLKHKDLRNMIQADAFNARLIGRFSPLFHLTQSATGLQLLAKSRHLRSLINIDSLNLTCVHGPEKGTSPLFWLISSEEGRDILMHDRHLRSIIEPQDVRVFRERDEVSIQDLLLLPECAALLKKLSPAVRKAVEERRQNLEGAITGWHASARFFAPQKKSPQEAEEMAGTTLRNLITRFSH